MELKALSLPAHQKFFQNCVPLVRWRSVFFFPNSPAGSFSPSYRTRQVPFGPSLFTLPDALTRDSLGDSTCLVPSTPHSPPRHPGSPPPPHRYLVSYITLPTSLYIRSLRYASRRTFPLLAQFELRKGALVPIPRFSCA